jgi:Zn-finger nucleic acid-binding protein
MAKFKVGRSLDFSLDRCGQCGGIWFDKNEWEILEGMDLQGQIHLIFSDVWQHRVRDAEDAKHLEKLFVEKVGERNFVEIKRIREWLDQHPHRRELRAYLDHGEF